MNLLSNYCRNRDIKTSITIGIVGWFFHFSLLMSFPSEFGFCQTYVVSYKTSSDAILINENAGNMLLWVFKSGHICLFTVFQVVSSLSSCCVQPFMRPPYFCNIHIMTVYFSFENQWFLLRLDILNAFGGINPVHFDWIYIGHVRKQFSLCCKWANLLDLQCGSKD